MIDSQEHSLHCIYTEVFKFVTLNNVPKYGRKKIEKLYTQILEDFQDNNGLIESGSPEDVVLKVLSLMLEEC